MLDFSEMDTEEAAAILNQLILFGCNYNKIPHNKELSEIEMQYIVIKALAVGIDVLLKNTPPDKLRESSRVLIRDGDKLKHYLAGPHSSYQEIADRLKICK